MHTTPVNHRAALTLFHLLGRVEPTAVVTGTKEVARIGGLVFTVALAQTVRHDEYDGVRLRVINPAVGQLDVTTLAFGEYRVTTGTGTGQRPLQQITPHTAGDLTDGVSTHRLEEAVRRYVAAFTGLDLTQH